MRLKTELMQHDQQHKEALESVRQEQQKIEAQAQHLKRRTKFISDIHEATSKSDFREIGRCISEAAVTMLGASSGAQVYHLLE